MPRFRIHRMKDHARQSFRWAAHTLGAANVKPRDYEPGTEIEAASPYAAWMEHRNGENQLQVGDLLESESGALFIYKYVGFEEARWVLPVSDPESTLSRVSLPM